MERPVDTQTAVQRDLRFNFTVGMFDGAFFGFALGFGSFIAIIPLFVKGLTNSALLIGLIPAIHNVGWQMPQLFTAGWVSRLRRYKPMVLWLTINERVPFLAMAAVAWFLPQLGPKWALVLLFPAMVWQGFGGGFTANAWQTMIAKIIPSDLHGTFFGTQSAAANGMAGVSAILAGLILEKLASPLDFAVCFTLAGIMMGISFIALAQTREHEAPPRVDEHPHAFWGQAREILKRDRNFDTFLVVRSLSQFASMAFPFYLIYAVFEYGMSEAMAGVMTSVVLIAQVAFSPLMGRLGDRWSHRGVMCIGALTATLSALLAWRANSLEWFYLVFALEAVSIVAIWTIPIALTVSFAGQDEQRPVYIGLSNTVTAPATILAPVIGGWIADAAGFHLTFLLSAGCGLLMAAMLAFIVKEPQPA